MLQCLIQKVASYFQKVRDVSQGAKELAYRFSVESQGRVVANG